MSAIPYPLDPLGKHSPYFQLIVKPGILGDSLTYGFTPYWWHTGGYCKVVDWGDGVAEDAAKGGTALTHTYAASGTYTIRIKADCQEFRFGFNGAAARPYAALVYDTNGNWDAIGAATGNLKSGYCMFQICSYARLSITHLPTSIQNGNRMFAGCEAAQLPITELPAGLTSAGAMFYNCKNSSMQLNKLPETLYGAINEMFYGCNKAVINLDELAANAPEGGWTEVTSIANMFYNAGSGNSPGTVTGSRSAFLAKLPNVTNTTNAFSGTNTTE